MPPHHLHHRDNSGFAIPSAAIIFLAILGAAFAVCCGVAVLRLYREDIHENDWRKRRPEQDHYMWAVRRRGMRRLSKEGAIFLGAGKAMRAPASPR
jgi:hypothetical protein